MRNADIIIGKSRRATIVWLGDSALRRTTHPDTSFLGGCEVVDVDVADGARGAEHAVGQVVGRAFNRISDPRNHPGDAEPVPDQPMEVTCSIALERNALVVCWRYPFRPRVVVNGPPDRSTSYDGSIEIGRAT